MSTAAAPAPTPRTASSRAVPTPFGLTPLLRVAAQALRVPVTGDVRWLYAGPRDLRGLTDSDRELIAVVTGEVIPCEPSAGLRVSFFALQVALDRLSGALPHGQDVSIAYLEDVYTRYDEGCPDGNPVSGDLLDLALAFLVGRDLARMDRESLVA